MSSWGGLLRCSGGGHAARPRINHGGFDWAGWSR
jgi:hypothetical protein